MNDYTLYLVKRAYYKKQLIKRALYKYALSEESAKNINTALLKRFDVYNKMGDAIPGSRPTAYKLIRDKVQDLGMTVPQAERSIVEDVYRNAGQLRGSQTLDQVIGSGKTYQDYMNEYNRASDRHARKGGLASWAAAVDKHNKKISGSRSTALVPLTVR